MTQASRCYRSLLRALPRRLSAEYQEDMVAAFEAMVASARTRGRWLPTLRVWIRALFDLLAVHRPTRSLPTREKRPPGEPRFQDLRFAVRVIRRQPLFALVAIATIAVGVSATTTIFSVANGLLLRAPAGVRGSGTLVTVHRIADDGSGFHAFGIPLYRHLASSAPDVVDLAAYSTFSGSLLLDESPWRVAGTIVSANYFDTVGARAGEGRFFHPDEDRVPGRDAVVVISDQLWRDRFETDPGVVGRDLVLNGVEFRIVGIGEPGFRGHLAAFVSDVWLPLSAQGLLRGATSLSEDDAIIGLEAVGARAPGVSDAQVHEALDAAARSFQAGEGNDWYGLNVLGYSPIVPAARTGLAAFLAAMFGVAGILLMITAVNVANMLLSRGAARSREMGVRLALGASRSRIVAQLLTESTVLFLGGGFLATVLTVWSTRLLGSIQLPIPLQLDLDFAPDLKVLLFALVTAAITGLVFGLSPALHATRGDLVGALKETPAQPRTRQRLRSLLVVAQVTASTVLLIVAGLLVRSMNRTGTVDLGLDIDGVYAFMLDTADANRSVDESVVFYNTLVSDLAELPGVGSVGAIDVPPLTGSNQQNTVILPDRPGEPGIGLRRVEYAAVSEAYLEAVGIPLLVGRGFQSTDEFGAPGVVIVNEYLARTFWPGENAVGKAMAFRTAAEPIPLRVIGVAADSKIRTPADPERPLVYGSWNQFPGRAYTIMLRADDIAVVAAARRRIAELDPVLPPADPVEYGRLMRLSLLPAYVGMVLATVFGGAGLLLVALGLYGLLAYSVSQRSQEIGVRMALGAPAAQVQNLVVRDGLRLTSIGIAIGLVASAGAAQLMRWMLFGLSPFDPVTFVGITVLLTSVAALASWLPAHRAAATDPVDALRAE